MRYHLGIDIGASGGRHIVGWVSDGKLLTREVYRFKNGMISKNGSVVWDTEKLYAEVLAGIAEAKRANMIPSTVAIDTWGVDYVLLDPAGEPILPVYAYRDGATDEVQAELSALVSEKELYARTGIQHQSFNSIYRLWCDKNQGRLDAAASLLMMPEYLAYRLTGKICHEYTNATTSALVNIKTGDWDYELIDRLGYSRRLFGKLSDAATAVGSFKREVQDAVGFDATVVLCPTHDTAAAVAACPLDADGVYISSGTWSLVGVENTVPVITERARRGNFTNEGGVNGTYRFLKNITGMWILQEIRRTADCTLSYDDMMRLARGSCYAKTVDPNAKELAAPENMADAIRELLNDKSLPLADVLACVYRSLAKGYADAVAEIECICGRSFDTVHIIGGGSKDEYLNTLTAEYTGKKVLAGPAEATAIGNIIFQVMYADSRITLEDARSMVKKSFEIKNIIGAKSMSRYSEAQKMYAHLGADTEKAIEILENTVISVHCWQGDDVCGFDSREALSGGIQATGNYPGKARTPKELMCDIDKAFSLIPGKKKLNLHASYAISDVPVERDSLKPCHFEKWVEFAKERGIGIDFNPTFFAHPMVKDGLTLSSPNEDVRAYWVRHGIACLRIAEYFAIETGYPCVMNIWIPDGYKDIPADRYGPRERFMKSLDEIISAGYDREKVYITLESKVFGIGLESYTVGSAEFCLSYADSRGITPLMDNGHYHPTESVADKISALLLFNDKIALHITRSVRWDSDHVVLFDDECREIAAEVVRNGLDKVFLATDYFDASVNRISAWVTGVRSLQKALLWALLQPADRMKRLQDASQMTELMVLNEEFKTAPFGDVWTEFLRRQNVVYDYLETIKEYEKKVLAKRT